MAEGGVAAMLLSMFTKVRFWLCWRFCFSRLSTVSEVRSLVRSR